MATKRGIPVCPLCELFYVSRQQELTERQRRLRQTFTELQQLDSSLAQLTASCTHPQYLPDNHVKEMSAVSQKVAAVVSQPHPSEVAIADLDIMEQLVTRVRGVRDGAKQRVG